MNNLEKNEWDSLLVTDDSSGYSRRRFLKLAGIFAGAGVVLSTACKKDDNNTTPTNPTTDTVDLGSGDTGVLNYAYALEQLEAAFYTKVCESFYANASVSEKAVLTSIRDHEIAHREFFKAALGSGAIKGLTVNFASIDFTSRTSVLGTAKAFEDLGVSAYNGAGKLISKVDYLALAGKIVSVEARHAAIIRDLITPNSFAGADVVSASGGLDNARAPKDVLSIAQAYVTTTITANSLPTT